MINQRAARRARRARVLRRACQITQFDSQYSSQRITYRGRYIKSKGKDIQLNLDVRNFIQPIDSFVHNFVKVSKVTNLPIDQKAHLLQQAIYNYITYTSDILNESYTEFWQFPFETLALRCGDCEDGAILMASAMIAAGIPCNRVRVFAGWVKTNNPKQPLGGHAYVVYLRNTDMQPVVLDWCYRQDSQIPVHKKPTLQTNPYYGESWFSFNQLNSWGKRSLRFASRKHLERP